MSTTIRKTDNTISVEAAFNSIFVSAARNLGGKWSQPVWVFDVRNEAAVRAACLYAYGTDGTTTDVVDIELQLSEADSERTGPITICGRTIAQARGRDTGARLGTGVIVKSGGFSSGGSAKNWMTCAANGTVVIVRDVSRRALNFSDAEFKILESDTSNSKLLEEKKRLIARLDAIELLLDS